MTKLCSSNSILSNLLFLILFSHLPFINQENEKNNSILPFMAPSSLNHQENAEHDFFTVPHEHYRQSEMDKVGKSMDLDIKHKLKINFDSLDREEKQIFMDIACFFIGQEKDMAMRIWKGSGWNAEHALQSLKDKFLVEDLGMKLTMQEHVRDFGREMAEELSRRRRIWRPDDLKSLELKGLKNILAKTSSRSFRSLYINLKDDSLESRISFFVGNSDVCAETSTVLQWLELDLYNTGLTNIPSWIPLQNLQSLFISSGCLERLWESDVEAPLHLKELVLEDVSLQELPNSLGSLNDLEKLELFFSCCYRIDNVLIDCSDEMLLEGRPLLESIRKLSNLRSLVLRNSKASGGVTFSNSEQSNIHNPPMSSLKSIEIMRLKLTSKFSISGKYCTSLESLHLEDMESLIEVDLAMVTTLKSLQLINCPKLKTVSGISDLTKVESLNIQSCPELEELPNIAHLSSLESITIDGSPKLLQNSLGIEELEGLKRLRLLVLGNGATWNYIHRLQRMPSELVFLIGRAVDGAVSVLDYSNLFSDLIDPDAFHEINTNKRGSKSLKRPHSRSAVIVCTVHGTNPESSHIDEGERVFTIVITDPTVLMKISNAPNLFARLSDPDLSHGWLSNYDPMHSLWMLGKLGYPTTYGMEKGCIVTLDRDEDWKALDVLKTVVDQLYKWS